MSRPAQFSVCMYLTGQGPRGIWIIQSSKKIIVIFMQDDPGVWNQCASLLFSSSYTGRFP